MMLSSTTYFTANCDICGKNFGKGMPTEQEQVTKLKEELWFVMMPNFGLACKQCKDRIAANEKLVEAILMYSFNESIAGNAGQ